MTQNNKEITPHDLPIVRGKLKVGAPLAHLTWFKVGGNADILFKPEDAEDLSSFLKQNAEKLQLPVMVLGAGSNIIIRDHGIEGYVIKLGRNFTDIEILPGGRLSVGAGCLNFNLAKLALANSIAGFEFLVGIPGTIGGGIAMNAGAYGAEFKDIVDTVFALDEGGNKHEIKVQDIGFSYRKNNLSKDLIFTKVIFNTKVGDPEQIQSKMDQISKARSDTQPVTEKTGGSSFANPKDHKAWELIDRVALRGKRIGGASMSLKHCNFMINHGDAIAKDMEDLGELVRNKVKSETGIELKWEIKRVGRNGKF